MPPKSTRKRKHAEKEDNPNLQEEPLQKKRGRPSNTSAAERVVETRGSTLGREKQRTRSGEQQRVLERRVSTKEGTKAKSDITKQTRSSPKSTNESAPSKKQGRRSTINDTGMLKSNKNHARAPLARRPEVSGHENEVGDVEPDPRSSRTQRKDASFQHLAAVHRKVSRRAIDSKWEPLTTGALERISQILSNVERSVVMQVEGDRKKTQASTAIQMINRRLHRKLIRGLPFPPGTRSNREEDFDFEMVLDSNRALETQLTPALHSVELLKAEIRREEAMLQRETIALQELERNAKADMTRRKQATRKLHTILQSNVQVIGSDVLEEIEIMDVEEPGLLDSAGKDAELKPVIGDFHSHLESMHNNIAQVDGLVPTIERSRGFVREVLFRHLDAVRYEQVLVG